MADAVIEGRQGEDSVATVEAELAATQVKLIQSKKSLKL